MGIAIARNVQALCPGKQGVTNRRSPAFYGVMNRIRGEVQEMRKGIERPEIKENGKSQPNHGKKQVQVIQQDKFKAGVGV